MRELLFFEWKKIFNKKLNVIAMAVGYLLILGVATNYIMQQEFWDEETQQYVSGVEAYEKGRERAEGTTDYLTEEYLTELTQSIQSQNLALDSDEAYVKIIRPMGYDFFGLLNSMYMDIGDLVDYNRINEISTAGGIGFYERRLERISEYLNMDFSYGNYSEAEKEFWLNKAKQVQTPFQWGETETMGTALMIIGISFYLLFVLAICIAPIFAAEYESGAAALLLTTKKGKNRLVTAKILAAVLFSLAYMSIGMGLGLLIQAMTIGFAGNHLPVQLWGVGIPYNWSVGRVCVLGILVQLLVALTITLLTLAWSSRLKTAFLVLVLDFVVIIGPAFFTMSKTSGLWNHINYLFPVNVLNMKEVLGRYNSYQFGELVLSYLTMIVLVYFALSFISLLSIKGGFAKHQVK